MLKQNFKVILFSHPILSPGQALMFLWMEGDPATFPPSLLPPQSMNGCDNMLGEL